MATKRNPPLDFDNLAEALERLGDIPPERIRWRPPPGTATEKDVIAALDAPNKRLCELVDGILVEKPMGTRESLLSGVIVQKMWNFVTPDDLGVVLPADGALRLMPGLVRIPDVSFIPWGNIPGERFSDAALASYIPDLAVEVLSKTNTKKEIARKLREYFLTGTRLAWVIDPKTQTAKIYTAPDEVRSVGKNGRLDGGVVLPGFSIAMADLLARTARRRKKGA
jgi:Uma2 family endonuclease